MSSLGKLFCDCESGLPASRCCKLDLSTLLAGEAVRHLAPLIEQALQSEREGESATAAQLTLDVLALAPSQPDMLWLLARLRRSQGRIRATEALLQRLVELHPNHLNATLELATLLLRKGALTGAEIHARNAVRLAPANPQSHLLLGMVLADAHRSQPAEFHYRRVLELTGKRDPMVLANLAWSLKLQGRMEEARACYEESAAAAPNELQPLLGWARLEEADRDFPRAAALLARAEGVAPDNTRVRLTQAVVHGRMGAYDLALAKLGEIAASREDGQLGPEEMLEKGRLLDRLGQHDQAFLAFTEGKALARKLSGASYAAEQASSRAAALRRFFVANRLALLPRAGHREDAPTPIFILGFPRSGTTLTEQMLSAHPSIAAGDELPVIHEIAVVMPRLLTSPLAYPEALSELWMGDRHEGLDTLRDHYLQRARQLGVQAAPGGWFTDKMPLNEFHLGLIALIFPEAPLVHVIRHPLDVMVSAFSNHFTHGFNCGAELETAARHYVLVADLVAHYRAEMNLRYLPVHYEHIVAAQEDELRRILDFIGAPFDPACLAFHQNRRYARTASYAQVTEPLYDRSRGRWRAYRRQLEPVLPILGPVIGRLGYSVE